MEAVVAMCGDSMPTALAEASQALRREAVSNRGKRLLDNLRASPEYIEKVDALNEQVRRKHMTPKERDAALSMLEANAHIWAGNSALTGFANPQQFFASFDIVTRYSRGGGGAGGGELRFQSVH